MYKLKDIIKSGGNNPRINKQIDKYVLSKYEKRGIINSIQTSTGGSSSEDNTDININQVYESNKVCWRINNPSHEEALDVLSLFVEIPIYSAIVKEGYNEIKAYGHLASLQCFSKLEINNENNYIIAFEETKINKFGDVIVNENDVLLSLLQTVGITESNLNELGIYKISHEEYLTIHDKVMNFLEFK